MKTTATAFVIAAAFFSTTAFAQSMEQQQYQQQQQQYQQQQKQYQYQQQQYQRELLEQQQRMMQQQQEQHNQMMQQASRAQQGNQPNGMVCSGGMCAMSGAGGGVAAALNRLAEDLNRQNQNR